MESCPVGADGVYGIWCCLLLPKTSYLGGYCWDTDGDRADVREQRMYCRFGKGRKGKPPYWQLILLHKRVATHFLPTLLQSAQLSSPMIKCSFPTSTHTDIFQHFRTFINWADFVLAPALSESEVCLQRKCVCLPSCLTFCQIIWILVSCLLLVRVICFSFKHCFGVVMAQ